MACRSPRPRQKPRNSPPPERLTALPLEGAPPAAWRSQFRGGCANRKQSTTMQAAAVTGIGWRHEHERDLLEGRPALPFIEVHSENFFAEGGAALALLRQARR